MAKTSSQLVPLGSLAPKFSLLDVKTGANLSLEYLQAPAIVIMFICNHCPYVKHINKELTKLAAEYIKKGVKFYAINSNEYENYPEDSPENMCITAKQEAYPFPYLFDDSQEVARAYSAACTPDFFIYDSEYKLAYHGQFDDSRPGNQVEVDGSSIRAALDALIAKEEIPSPQKLSLGCNIKWKM